MEYPQEKVKPYGQEGKKVEQVERMFDHIAPAYDRLNHLMSLGIDRSWRRTALKWLRPHRPQQMMDVATGTGDFALLACRMLRPQSLVGTDISEGMMQVARHKAREAGLDDRIRFRREDCEALTFSDASFDAVTVAFGIRNFEHLDRGLREMSGHPRTLHARPPAHEATLPDLLTAHPADGPPRVARPQCLHLPAAEHPRLPAR